MREVTETFKVYKYSTAPEEVKERIRENINYNWDLYEFNMQERIKTLEKLAETLNGKLDYSLSCVASRGEFIKIIPKNNSLDFSHLWSIIKEGKDCPLTGVCYDHDILDYFDNENKLTRVNLHSALENYINFIHDEYEHMLKDEYLEDFCDGNDYEFTEDGKLY